jgi:hypothetical protein
VKIKHEIANLEQQIGDVELKISGTMRIYISFMMK